MAEEQLAAMPAESIPSSATKGALTAAVPSPAAMPAEGKPSTTAKEASTATVPGPAGIVNPAAASEARPGADTNSPGAAAGTPAPTVTRAPQAPENPQFSVIVPVYNVEDYLDACLDSLEAQTNGNFEAVCVNDGTPDGSRTILERRQQADPRIVIVDKQNGGLSSARNAGLNAARGTYVCFLDADDRFTPNALERIARAFGETDADVVTFGGYCNPAEAATPWINLKLSPRDVVYNGFKPALMFEEQSTPYIRTACRCAFLNSNNIRFEEELPFGEDQVFFFDIYPNSKKTALISDKLYEYRIEREGSLTSKTNDDLEAKSRKHLPMTDRIFSAWKSRFGTQQYSTEIVSWSIEFVLYGLFCLPEPVRSELLQEYVQVFRRFWGEGSTQALQLKKNDRRLLETALSGKPVSNPEALRLRLGWFLEKYGAKAIVGKALGMN